MNFASFDFMIFFSIIIGLLYLVKSNKIKKIVLLIGSYFFYGYWDIRFLTLILISTSIDYFIGLKLRKTNEKNKKIFLNLSFIINLGLLGFFKYYNFFIETFNDAFGGNVSSLNIILPVGISFYTFQTLSYTIDIYRGKLEPESNYVNFALFVSFFPQLVAGPIVRASDFLPQLKYDIELKLINFNQGIQIFLFGMLKKVLIADRLAFYVDNVFEAPAVYSSLTIWFAVIAYSIQIYCDFSGYSDMAIGLARIMGFKLTKNFDIPYISQNITEFWRRWHISLSSWLRDYLYISLGGNRKGKTRMYANIMITMLLGGLWHGASYNFLLWGGAHGTALIIHKIYSSKIKKFFKVQIKLIDWAITYIFVISSWVLFRATTITDALLILKKMFIPEDGIQYIFTSLLIIIPLIIIAHLLKLFNKNDDYILVDVKKNLGLTFIVFVVLCLFLYSPETPTPFIYFQF